MTGGIGLTPGILELEGFARRELPHRQHHRHDGTLEPPPHLAARCVVDRDIERRRSSLQVERGGTAGVFYAEGDRHRLTLENPRRGE